MRDPVQTPPLRGDLGRGDLGEIVLNRTLHPRDWENPEFLALMEEIAPGAEPRVYHHRKAWEFAMGILTLERCGALHDDAVGLSVGAGHEAILYYLANRAGWILATDIYGSGGFDRRESSAAMLTDPDLFAPYPYRRRRLTVVYMNALDLRFEDGRFDFVVSFGSIEHFGGQEAAAAALAESVRVVRPGGAVFLTTETVVDGGPHVSLPGLELFTPETLATLVESCPDVEPIGPVDYRFPPGITLDPVSLMPEVARIDVGDQTFPQTALSVPTDHGNRVFTSVSLALQRRSPN